MIVARELYDDIVAHAREEFDAECCGVIAYEQLSPDGDGEARQVRRTRNIHESPKRFEIDGMELYRASAEFEERGWEIGALYHSHTHTAPYPSQTDVNFSAQWPGVEWVIVGLAGEQPEVRCYLIEEGQVREVPLQVV